jgi:hypothetical protein
MLQLMECKSWEHVYEVDKDVSRKLLLPALHKSF